MSDNREDEELLRAYTGLKTNASHRTYIDIDTNRSVRPSYAPEDYFAFRPNESSSSEIKAVIKCAMNAYDKVGIIKNVVDLMGDFASQGITLAHEDKKTQRFYRSWWKAVNGDHVSERFLNNLYRCGNVVVKRSYAKINKKNQSDMSAKASDDIEIEKIKVLKRRIPYKFNFLNPLVLEVKGGAAAAFVGLVEYQMNLSPAVVSAYKDPNNSTLLGKLPANIKRALDSGSNVINLDMENIRTFYYKKDDWSVWANPMIHAILDDIAMFEKFKLADLSALDGVISNIRLWTLGDLEHKILPTPEGINRLRDIVASNTGGGVMDLIWGPELKFTESNTQAYHFLGNEKYEPVLNSIYAGVGIPQTLTGNAGGSGYTNNFISLKTLIDRLEYGRGLLRKFWEEEIKLVQLAMGFTKPAKLHYDFMISSDENTLKKLWIELSDRNIISLETLRERMNEDNDIEESRIKQEMKSRKDKKIPEQAGPYHNGDSEQEYIKIALSNGELSIKDIIDDIEPSNPGLEKEKLKLSMQKKTPAPNGRPPMQKDTKPRKQRTVLPKTKSAMSNYILWANDAQKKIADILNEPLLNFYQKKNLRELSTVEAKESESIKFNVLTKIEPLSPINQEEVVEILKTLGEIDREVLENSKELNSSFFAQKGRLPTLDESKQLNSFAYILTFCEENT